MLRQQEVLPFGVLVGRENLLLSRDERSHLLGSLFRGSLFRGLLLRGSLHNTCCLLLRSRLLRRLCLSCCYITLGLGNSAVGIAQVVLQRAERQTLFGGRIGGVIRNLVGCFGRTVCSCDRCVCPDLAH